jgi:hypothetical protein
MVLERVHDTSSGYAHCKACFIQHNSLLRTSLEVIDGAVDVEVAIFELD